MAVDQKKKGKAALYISILLVMLLSSLLIVQALKAATTTRLRANVKDFLEKAVQGRMQYADVSVQLTQRGFTELSGPMQDSSGNKVVEFDLKGQSTFNLIDPSTMITMSNYTFIVYVTVIDGKVADYSFFYEYPNAF